MGSMFITYLIVLLCYRPCALPAEQRCAPGVWRLRRISLEFRCRAGLLKPCNFAGEFRVNGAQCRFPTHLACRVSHCSSPSGNVLNLCCVERRCVAYDLDSRFGLCSDATMTLHKLSGSAARNSHSSSHLGQRRPFAATHSTLRSTNHGDRHAMVPHPLGVIRRQRAQHRRVAANADGQKDEILQVHAQRSGPCSVPAALSCKRAH